MQPEFHFHSEGCVWRKSCGTSIATKNCLVFIVTKSESFFVPMSLCSIGVRLHGSSLPASDNAATISSVLSTCTSSSKKAKSIRVSLRYHRWRRKVFRATLATASLVALYFTSCCNNFIYVVEQKVQMDRRTMPLSRL